MASPRKYYGSTMKFFKIKLGYVVLLLVALSIPSTLLLVKQQQITTQQASGPNDSEKIVNGLEVTNEEINQRIKDEYGDSYQKYVNDAAIISQTKNQLLKEKVIQKEATRQNITISQTTINNALKEENRQDTYYNRTAIYNRLLEEAVKQAVISWRKIDAVTVFRNPLASNYTVLLNDAKNKLGQMREVILNGSSIESAYNQINTPKDNSLILQQEVLVTKNSGWIKALYEPLFQLKNGDISEVVDSESGSLILAKIIDANDTPYDNFDSWYENQVK